MLGFLKKAFGGLFSSKPDENELPDDGGLGDFARELAEELEAEADGRLTRGSLSAEQVLSMQKGAKGASVYLVDISGFLKETVEALRDSVVPVTEGILKSKCGDSGKGFMKAGPVYVFNVHRKTPEEEYNAAMDIIDMIGVHLLGDRYKTGRRKSLDVPVAKVLPDSIFKEDGTFDLSKASEAIQFVRNSGVKAPCEIDWEKGTAAPPKQARQWRENHLKKKKTVSDDWKTQKLNPAPSAALGEWQKVHHKKAEESQTKDWKVQAHNNPAKDAKKDWETLEHVKPGQAENADWEKIEQVKSASKESPDLVTVESQAPKPKKTAVQAIDLKQLGVVFYAFRPTWSAKDEALNIYDGHAYRKVSGVVQKGEQIYPEDLDLEQILQIDEALARQAAEHIEGCASLGKVRIVLPFHYKSLGVDAKSSPIACLFDLTESQRESLLIELVGLGSGASPSRVAPAIEQARKHFANCGIRLELGDVSKSLVERCRPGFISCDVAESNAHGLQMRGIDVDLPEFTNLAKGLKLESFVFGISAKPDLMFALQEGGNYLNGVALAKELRKPSKVVPLSAAKLLGSG